MFNESLIMKILCTFLILSCQSGVSAVKDMDDEGGAKKEAKYSDEYAALSTGAL